MKHNIDITLLLNTAGQDDGQSVDKILPIVYSELHSLARGILSGERPEHTLQSTALVHEAYLRLVDQRQDDYHNRAHFFAIASMVIRRILVDHARRRATVRRGGGATVFSLDEIATVAADSPDQNIIALDEAMAHLAQKDERSARVVEMRFFGGLTNAEIGTVLDVHERTVQRDWLHARAWLYRHLNLSAPDPIHHHD